MRVNKSSKNHPLEGLNVEMKKIIFVDVDCWCVCLKEGFSMIQRLKTDRLLPLKDQPLLVS